MSAKKNDHLSKKMADKAVDNSEKSVIISGLPKPQNGRIFGRIVSVESKTASGIIIPELTSVKTTADELNGREVRGRNPRPLILEVIDVADDVKIEVKNGQLIMVDNTYREHITQIGEHSFVIVHALQVEGVWRK